MNNILNYRIIKRLVYKSSISFFSQSLGSKHLKRRMKLLLLLIVPLAYGQVSPPNDCPPVIGEYPCAEETIRCPSKYDDNGCPTDFTCQSKWFLNSNGDGKDDRTCMAFCLGVECKPGEYKVSLGTDANNC